MPKRPKILVLTHSFPTAHNPQAAIFLSNQLQSLKKHCDIKVIFPYPYAPRTAFLNPYRHLSTVPKKESINGMEIFHPKYLSLPRFSVLSPFFGIILFIESFFSYIQSIQLAKDIVEQWNPDVIHLHDQLGSGLIGRSLKKKYNTPLFVTVHGQDIMSQSKQLLLRPLIHSTLRSSDAIICVSKALQHEIISKGITTVPFHVIPMGAKTDLFRPKDKTAARRALGLPKDRKIVLFVGNLIPLKGVDHLIKAIGIMSKQDSTISAFLIGRGSQEGQLKELAKSLDLDSIITFLGYRSSKEVAAYMNACDLLVLPSLTEGLPVVLCEAISCGKPVVATRVGGSPEIVTPEVGFLADPKNDQDLADKVLKALGKIWNKGKILRHASTFSVDHSARRLFKLYGEALKSKPFKKKH